MSGSNTNSSSFAMSCRASEVHAPSMQVDPLFHKILDDLLSFPLTDVPPLSPLFFDSINLPVDHYQQSTSLQPILLPTINSSQLLPQDGLFEQLKQPLGVEPNDSQSGKIQINTEPRPEFRPRTEKESRDSSHFIRSANNIQPGYPSIHLKPSWKTPKSIIEVALVTKDRQPHPYTIENKQRHTSPLIFKSDEANKLYFHLTDEDFNNKMKIFHIEYIKAKQDDVITKDRIKAEELDQSMLCFTRFYALPDGSYQQDDASVAYSCIMTENYGDLTIEDVFPSYGPMCGNQKVCIESKGALPKGLKTDLAITIKDPTTGWSHQIQDVNKNRNNFIFTMPRYPYQRTSPAKVTIQIQYKNDIVYETTYMYTGKLDDELRSANTNNLLPVHTVAFTQGTKRPRLNL